MKLCYGCGTIIFNIFLFPHILCRTCFDHEREFWTEIDNTKKANKDKKTAMEGK